MFKKILLVILFVLPLLKTGPVWAQDATPTENMEAKVVKIIEDKTIDVEGSKQPYQKLELLVTKGSLKNQRLIIENGNLALANVIRYRLSDKLIVSREKDPNGKDIFDIVDSVRRDSLLLLTIIFVVLTVFMAKWKGVTSLLSVVITFAIIFKFILPFISNGANPVLIALSSSLVIVPAIFYLSHGFNKKTTVAIMGTFIALVVTAILASVFIELSKLYGFSTEEAGMLSTIKHGTINMQGILLAGIIIGALGVLDDITVSQAAIVEQLHEASEKLKFHELYMKAMKVGQDHITSMVNTLILAYASASLPLLLIFTTSPKPFGEIVNLEFIAEEIVRTLVGSIGLIVAVPITNFIACSLFWKDKKKKSGAKANPEAMEMIAKH